VVEKIEEPIIPKFKSKLLDASVSSDDKNFTYSSPSILLQGDEKYKLVVKGLEKINCGCTFVKNTGA
jgi:hypothetical protein